MVKAALITGICGFIGSHLADELVKQGYTVHGVDNLSFGDMSNIKHLEDKIDSVLLNDFASEKVLSRVMSGLYDQVFHLAAIASVPFSVDHPVSTNKINVSSTVELLEACRLGKVQKFVFSSSSAVYGDSEEPMVETNRVVPSRIQSPYALQKYEIENWCNLYSRVYGLPTACLRYFNVFGPRQRAGGAYANLISSWCSKLVASEKLTINGNGTDTRDYVYVKDVAKANLLLANTKSHPLVVNVGSNTELSVNEIASLLQFIEPSCEFDHAPARKGDVRRTKAEPGFVNKHFTPRAVTKELLAETLNWYKAVKTEV